MTGTILNIEPTVGIHPSGRISVFRNAFTNLEACSLTSGMPSIMGYTDATPR